MATPIRVGISIIKALRQSEVAGINHREALLKLSHDPALTLGTKTEQCSAYVPVGRKAAMLKIFVEEAAALASIALFVGMIAVWAQLIPQL